MTSNDAILNPVDNNATVQEMLLELENERSSVPNGVLSRWQVINNSLMKYWRFRMIFTVAGASGSAKSYFLNQLRQDLTDMEDFIVNVSGISKSVIDNVLMNGEFIERNGYLIRPALNPSAPFTVLNMHFGFEMHPIYELLRTISALTGFGYQYLLSSYGQRVTDDSGIKYVYNRLTDNEMMLVRRVAESLVPRMKNMLVFKNPGTRQEIYNTVYSAYNRYAKTNNNVRLSVTLDHSLLAKKAEESGDLEMQNELIRTLLQVRDDFGAMVVPIIQTNSNMEDPRRRSDINSHYPVKSDLYMGGQFYQGSDFVAVMLQPMSIGIGEYGPRKIPTKQLIHWSLIKSRYNVPGQIWLWNDLQVSKLRTCLIDENNNQPIVKPNLVSR